MKIIVNITKSLQPSIPHESLEILANDYYDIFSFLREQFPKVRELVSINKTKHSSFEDFCLIQNKKVIEISKLRNKIRSDSPIYLVPIVFGGAPTYGTRSSSYYNDLKASFMYPLFGLSTASYEQMDLEGLHKRVIDSSLFGRAENVYDVGVRESNDIFKGLQLTNSSKNFVPLVYGEIRVAGNIINSRVTNYRAHPDLFRVTDVVNTDRNEVALPIQYAYADYVDVDYFDP